MSNDLEPIRLRPAARGPLAALALVVLSLVIAVAEVASAQQAAQPPPAPQDTGEAPRRVVVRFLTEGDFPPFNFYDEEGVLTGFNVDLARAICLELTAACDIKVRPWDELLPGLRRGEADAVIAGHTITPKALVEFEFTDRYFHTPGRFAVKKGDARTELTPESLDGVKLGVAKGTAHEAYLRTFFRDSSIQPFDSVELARDALMLGKVEALFDDGVSLAFWLNGTLSRQCCEFKGGPYFEPRYFGDGMAMAVPKNDPQIRRLINGALKRVRASGRFDELVQRYFPTRVY